jgi:hypothetical protein
MLPKSLSVSMSTGNEESMAIGDGASVSIGDKESMAIGDRAGEPVDPDPVVPMVGAN